MAGTLRFAYPAATVVMPREGGASSMRRPLGLCIDVSGILDHPLSRVMTAEKQRQILPSNSRISRMTITSPSPPPP